eukprot:12077308-Alexandrium_andersonii.AAC.1
MRSGRMPFCLARYGVPPATRASWGAAFWQSGLRAAIGRRILRSKKVLLPESILRLSSGNTFS